MGRVVRAGLGGIRSLRDGRRLCGVLEWVCVVLRLGGSRGGGERCGGRLGWRRGVVVQGRRPSPVLGGRVLEEIRDIHRCERAERQKKKRKEKRLAGRRRSTMRVKKGNRKCE